MKKYLTQKSKAKNSITYEIVWHDMLAGTATVSNEHNKPVVFIAYPGINLTYGRQIAKWLSHEFERDISIQVKNKTVLLKYENAKKPIVEKQNNLNWRTYTIQGNTYIGKIAEFEHTKHMAVELCVKPNVFADDVIYSVRSLFKKYTLVKLTMRNKPDIFANIEIGCDASVLNNIVMKKFGLKFKNDKQNQIILDDKDTNDEHDDAPQTPNVDPMILSKIVTVTMNKKQTVDMAKQRAQQMANLQYVAVKLFDADGKFICNIYPQDVEKIRAECAAQIKRMLHRQY